LIKTIILTFFPIFERISTVYHLSLFYSILFYYVLLCSILCHYYQYQCHHHNHHHHQHYHHYHHHHYYHQHHVNLSYQSDTSKQMTTVGFPFPFSFPPLLFHSILPSIPSIQFSPIPFLLTPINNHSSSSSLSLPFIPLPYPSLYCNSFPSFEYSG
jgi:hypothetical protein